MLAAAAGRPGRGRGPRGGLRQPPAADLDAAPAAWRASRSRTIPTPPAVRAGLADQLTFDGDEVLRVTYTEPAGPEPPAPPRVRESRLGGDTRRVRRYPPARAAAGRAARALVGARRRRRGRPGRRRGVPVRQRRRRPARSSRSPTASRRPGRPATPLDGGAWDLAGPARQGRRAELLGSVVRAVPGRGAGLRARPTGPPRRRASSSSASPSATSETTAARLPRRTDDRLPEPLRPAGKTVLRFRDLRRRRLPFTIVIDKQGRVAAVYPSALLREDIEPVVTRLAAEYGEPRRAGEQLRRRSSPTARSWSRRWSPRSPGWSASCRRACCRWCPATCHTSAGLSGADAAAATADDGGGVATGRGRSRTVPARCCSCSASPRCSSRTGCCSAGSAALLIEHQRAARAHPRRRRDPARAGVPGLAARCLARAADPPAARRRAGRRAAARGGLRAGLDAVHRPDSRRGPVARRCPRRAPAAVRRCRRVLPGPRACRSSLVALGARWLVGALGVVRRHAAVVTYVGGGLLVVLGLLLVTGSGAR